MESAEQRYVSGDVTIVYTETSPKPHAEPYRVRSATERVFILVHGIGMGRIVYQDVVPILAEHGRVVALDLPGFGDSPEPGSKTTIEETAQNVARFMRDKGLSPAVLVGHSMGTQVVAQLAASDPDLVSGLVLIAPTINRHERSAVKQAERMMQDMSGEGLKVLATGVVEYFKTSSLWFISKLKVMLAHRLEEVCQRVQVPTLVLWGETDKVCPREWVAEVAAALPDSTMRAIPDRGHEAIIKSPEPVATMILEYVDTL
ncbi:pimeloyl-ACP methyl ester carboxylesterase [Leucobacter exalbidus]|uniref:Pimeloyl-ACP methyl ester carboxylesterase n=1 Tax=Leucobacter exalbidus TaxID=662960 RepID=A0A940PSL2_9MICO|nr:alpha/beta hydrolase [Leucobacter exalbidus]MBP1326023.1 pimeloyl-ACP methyl ester carboxylesterase [Leucobacter exalbidus]